jgi:hypothetical protein
VVVNKTRGTLAIFFVDCKKHEKCNKNNTVLKH